MAILKDVYKHLDFVGAIVKLGAPDCVLDLVVADGYVLFITRLTLCFDAIANVLNTNDVLLFTVHVLFILSYECIMA